MTIDQFTTKIDSLAQRLRQMGESRPQYYKDPKLEERIEKAYRELEATVDELELKVHNENPPESAATKV